MKMLSFRCPHQLNEDVSLQDKDTARLLSEGKKKKTQTTPKIPQPSHLNNCSTL